MGQGGMAVFQDPTGAFFSVFQSAQSRGLEVTNQPGSYGWAGLSTRGIDKARVF